MKTRLLVWSDLGLIQLGIAKHLQRIFDIDIYAIHDVIQNQKNFFSNQNFVNFCKVWFYRDYISGKSKKPDLEYLQSIEEKYDLNLWEMIYGDSIFYPKNPYHEFIYEEILSILEKEYRFFENVLDEVKPDFLLTKTTESRSKRFAELCKARGVKVLMLNGMRFRNKSIYSEESDMFDTSWNLDGLGNKPRNLTEIKNYFSKHNVYKPTNEISTRGFQLPFWKKIKPALHFITRTYNSNYDDFYGFYGRNIPKIALRIILNKFTRNYREFFINRKLERKISNEEKFVYFPLHLQPERTIDVVAPLYNNQIEIVASIAKSLPVGYKLYVKEHPVQLLYNWRNVSYYKQILDLPNVKLIHPSIKPTEIYNKCSLVITVSGSAGLEALVHGKPVITFSDVEYVFLPSIYRIKNIEDLPKVIRSLVGKQTDPQELNKYLDLVEKYAFDFDIVGTTSTILNKFYYKGFYNVDNISTQKVDEFFEESKEKFELAAQHFFKKMNQIKNISS